MTVEGDTGESSCSSVIVGKCNNTISKGFVRFVYLSLIWVCYMEYSCVRLHHLTVKPNLTLSCLY